MNLNISIDSLKDPNTLVQVLQRAMANVPEVHWFDVQFAGSFMPVSVYHKLGRVPLGLLEDRTIDAVVWAEPNDRQEWSGQRVVVRCNAENVRMRVGLIT